MTDQELTTDLRNYFLQLILFPQKCQNNKVWRPVDWPKIWSDEKTENTVRSSRVRLVRLVRSNTITKPSSPSSSLWFCLCLLPIWLAHASCVYVWEKCKCFRNDSLGSQGTTTTSSPAFTRRETRIIEEKETEFWCACVELFVFVSLF